MAPNAVILVYIKIKMLVLARKCFAFGMGRRMDKLGKSFRKDFTVLQSTKIDL